MPIPSSRSAISPFIVMQVMAAANARAATGADVLHLEIGEPGGGAPHKAVAAARKAMANVSLGYTEALGLPALRHRIAQHYADWYSVEIPVERIAVTAGASGAFVLAFLAAFEAGDRVALAEPGYPAYRNILKAIDIEAVPLPAGAEHRFQPTPALVNSLVGRINGLIVASPANPTGTMLDRTALRDLMACSRERNIQLISDEIYHGISYGPAATSLLELTDQAIVVNSFSKFFCMTGWRIGWMVIPEYLVDPVERLAQNLFISPSAIGQHAALAAFSAEPELHAKIAGYRRNRDVLLKAFANAGIDRLAPADGAFYLYADISGFGIPSAELCRLLLEEIGVAVTPGLDFDAKRGKDFIRLSFAGEEATIAEAGSRLETWFKTRD